MRVLVRGDSGAGAHAFLAHLHRLNLQYSVGIGGWPTVLEVLATLPRQAWKAALDVDGQPAGASSSDSQAAGRGPRSC